MQIKTGDRWKRVGVSFASAVAAELIVGVGVVSIDGGHLIFEHMFGFVYFASILVVPGWLIALLIILQPRFDSLRLWQQILIGTFIGPTIMILIGFVGFASNPAGTYGAEAYPWLYVAIAISFIASTIYVAAMRQFSTTRIQTNL
jgi:hypothetical protein